MSSVPSDSPQSASLNYPEGEYSLPIESATVGYDSFDLGAMLSKTGYTTYDPGFGNTSACKSSITFIDGGEGILRHRGYPIDQLANQATFLEVAYLLIHDANPTREELDAFRSRIAASAELPEQFSSFFSAYPAAAHPMNVIAAGVNLLGTFHNDIDIEDWDQINEATERLLGRLPVLAAAAYRTSQGKEPIAPNPELGYTENFLRMTFGEDVDLDPANVRALDMLLTLHADHEQNCSTSTVRMVGSSQADLYSSIAAGINALYGPRHGGANQAVLEMLERIEAEGGDVQSYMAKVKNKEGGRRLMGFGHRVYRNYDPRAAIIKDTAHEILERLGGDDLLAIAQEVEAAALADDYFKQRKLYPNVDFYTGLIYRAMGFPTEMFTVLFAIGRLPGWIAHWREQLAEPGMKINRPRQVYTGPGELTFVPLDQRS